MSSSNSGLNRQLRQQYFVQAFEMGAGPADIVMTYSLFSRNILLYAVFNSLEAW
jgi:hypothetical protein